MMSREESLARESAAMARELAVAGDLARTLARIVHLAVEAVDGCEGASVTLLARGSIVMSAGTPGLGERFDELNRELGRNPCIDELDDEEFFEVSDLPHDDRWRRFGRHAAEQTGVRSLISLRLFVTEEQTMGVLHLYATQPDAFGDEDWDRASVLAAHASAAIRAVQRREQLAHAVATREIIGQAKGIIMARKGVDSDTAFTLLRAASNHTHRKLHEVAQELVDRSRQN